jgi:hypothetical protein
MVVSEIEGGIYLVPATSIAQLLTDNNLRREFIPLATNVRGGTERESP